jgi:hypothetical protein
VDRGWGRNGDVRGRWTDGEQTEKRESEERRGNGGEGEGERRHGRGEEREDLFISLPPHLHLSTEEYLALIERLAARPILCTDAAADAVRREECVRACVCERRE